MTYEKKSVIELREIAKERKIKGISTLKKQKTDQKYQKNYDQEQSKQQEDRIKIAIDAGHQKKQMSEKEAIGPGLIRQNRWYPQEPKVLLQNEQNIR